LETSKVVSLTASTKAPSKAPNEGKCWPLPQLISFQASTLLKPLKWCGRCDSPGHNCKCQAKNRRTPLSPFWHQGQKFQYDEELTVGPKQQQTVETPKHKTIWEYPIQVPTKPKQAQQTMGTSSDNRPYIQLSTHVRGTTHVLTFLVNTGSQVTITSLCTTETHRH
jgi:hypothetical protein